MRLLTLLCGISLGYARISTYDSLTIVLYHMNALLRIGSSRFYYRGLLVLWICDCDWTAGARLFLIVVLLFLLVTVLPLESAYCVSNRYPSLRLFDTRAIFPLYFTMAIFPFYFTRATSSLYWGHCSLFILLYS